MGKFDNIKVSPDLERIQKVARRTVLKNTRDVMQEYLDESSVGDLAELGFLEGLKVTPGQAATLFNDFLLYMAEGDQTQFEPINVEPTNGKST